MDIKKTIMVAVAIATLGTTTALQAADVGVSVSVGQPGFYGQIDIGNYPRPVLISPQPIVIQRPVGVVYEPIYLHVPPGHAKRWGSYCGRYNACNRPVYFVQERWYNDVYVPEYRGRHEEHYRDSHEFDDDDRGPGHGWKNSHGNDHGHGHHH